MTGDLGAHLSVAGGLATCFDRAAEAGVGAVQIFVKNQRQWAAKALGADEVGAFAEAWSRARQEGLLDARGAPRPPVTSIVAHATYLVNLASDDAEIFEKSVACLADELARADALGLQGVIVHPGSTRGDRARGIARIAEGAALALARSGARRTELLLEGTAGSGGQLGSRFEELAAMIAALPPAAARRTGICIDTCHLHVAGYALTSAGELQETLDALDASVGLSRLRAIHVNDAKAKRGTKLDRHANLGEGTIGLACFEALLHEPRLRGIPKVLETPEEDDGHARDLAILRAMRGSPATRAPRPAPEPVPEPATPRPASKLKSAPTSKPKPKLKPKTTKDLRS